MTAGYWGNPPARRLGRPRVKVCCIASREEAETAIRHGASALGLVSEMPSGPGVISEERIAEIAAAVPPGVSTFLLTSRRSVEEIVAQQRHCGTDTVQICDRLEGSHRELRAALPGIRIVQVVHVAGEASVAEALALAGEVHAILLDSGRPAEKVKVLGGTGRAHDWAVSRRIVEASRTPVFLAGGLKPENVAEAFRTTRPYGLDLCSGVRTGGRLDESKLAAFFRRVEEAARSVEPPR